MSKNYLETALDNCKKFNEEFDRPYFDNFGEQNIKSLRSTELPEEAIVAVEVNHGAGCKVDKPSEESLNKTAKMLMD